MGEDVSGVVHLLPAAGRCARLHRWLRPHVRRASRAVQSRRRGGVRERRALDRQRLQILRVAGGGRHARATPRRCARGDGGGWTCRAPGRAGGVGRMPRGRGGSRVGGWRCRPPGLPDRGGARQASAGTGAAGAALGQGVEVTRSGSCAGPGRCARPPCVARRRRAGRTATRPGPGSQVVTRTTPSRWRSTVARRQFSHTPR